MHLDPIADAFTGQAFVGDPLAILLEAVGPSPDQMQRSRPHLGSAERWTTTAAC